MTLFVTQNVGPKRHILPSSPASSPTSLSASSRSCSLSRRQSGPFHRSVETAGESLCCAIFGRPGSVLRASDRPGKQRERRTTAERKEAAMVACDVVFALPRALVSQNKRRFQDGGFDLDLTYVHPRVIVMGACSEGGPDRKQRTEEVDRIDHDGRVPVVRTRERLPQPAVRSRTATRSAPCRALRRLQLLRRAEPMVSPGRRWCEHRWGCRLDAHVPVVCALVATPRPSSMAASSAFRWRTTTCRRCSKRRSLVGSWLPSEPTTAHVLSTVAIAACQLNSVAFCEDAAAWLARDEQNVVALHCKVCDSPSCSGRVPS